MLDALQTDPIAFTIPIGGGFPVFWDGIIIVAGILIGTIWGSREVERRGENVDEFFNGLLIAILSGYFFARLAYVLLDVLGGNGASYGSFLDVINLRRGGANILGGFIGAFLCAYVFIKWRRLNVWHMADITGPILLIAQGIGRWGNFINQELYGPPTDLPWGITITNRLAQFQDLPAETRFHPTFLYESIWLIIGYIVLITLNNRMREQWEPGTLFSLFLMWWGGGRFFIEFFRPDQTTVGDSIITYSMLLSVGIFLAGLYLYFKRTGRIGQKKASRPVKPKPRRS